MKIRFALLASAALGLTGVGLGAFGAHALREQLTQQGMRAGWETAVHYHLLHAVATFTAASLTRTAGPVGDRAGRAAAWWTLGVVLFSGSLYVMAFGGPKWLGATVTPLGGIAFLVGWCYVAAAAFAKEET